MHQKNNLYFLLLLLCHSIATGNPTTFHRYLWANYNHFSGNFSSANKWYNTLFSSHCSLYTYKGYLTFLADTNQHSKIIELIPSLDKKFEKDPEVQLLFAIALEKEKQINQADNRLIKLSNAFKSNSEVTLRTTQAYIRRKEPENALLTIDTFLNNSPRKPNNFIFYFLKSQIHLQLSQLQKALINITACLDMHPRFDKGWLLFATLQEQQGEIKKALQGYGTFLELSGGNNSIEQHLFSLLLQHKSNESHASFHKSYFDQALSLLSKKEYATSLQSLNKYLSLQPDDHQAFILKIELLAQLNDHKQITDLLSELIKKNKNTPDFWPKNFYLLHHKGINKEKIISTLQTLSKKHTDNYWLPLYAADLSIRAHKSSDAVALLEQALNISTDTLLNAKIYHQLGLLYYEMHNYPQMIHHLEKGYALNNNLAHLNNSLAYYWTTKGKDAQKAQYFFNTIDDTHKTNPCFLDTQAVIFYKQQQYGKAQEILEKLEPYQNATILLHLAKTHYKLNNKDKAIALSKQAAAHITNNQEEKRLKKLQLLLAVND